MKIQKLASLFFLWVLVVLLFPTNLSASIANIYISQSGSGGGTSCSDATSAAFFNSSANWGSGASQIGPGTTVHLCGTFSASAGTSGMLNVNGSGSSGNPIRIQFESGANATAPYWGTGGFINLGSNAFIQIDGSPTSTPCGYVNHVDVSCNGKIQASANGASLANQVANGHAINSTGHDIEIRNLACINLFVPVINSANNEGSNGPNNTSCVWWLAGSGGGNMNSHNLQIQNSWNGVLYAYEGSNSNMHSDNNWCITVENCTQIGAGESGASINTGSWNNNDASNMAPWDTPGDRNHHEFIHLYTQQPGATITNFTIAGNYLHGTLGEFMTAEIYVECDGGSNCTSPTSIHVAEFDNVIVNEDNNADISNGSPPGGNTMTECEGSTCQIYNNTYYSDVAPNSSLNCAMHLEAGSVITVRNNIFAGMNCAISNSGGTVTADTNLGYSLTTSCGSACSSSGNPLLNIASSPPYQLQSGSAAVGIAANLTSLGIAGLDNDALGNARPSGSTPWDMGAFNGNSSAGSVSLTPTSSNFGSVNVGASSSNVTFTLSNSTAVTVTGITVSFVTGFPGDFVNTNTGTCGTSLASGSNCTIIVKFSPTAAGTRTTTLNVADSDASSPQQSALSGTGVAGSMTISPASENFGSVSVGSSSSDVTFTLANATASTVTGITVTFVGGNTGDFVNVGTGTCGSSLANGSSCTIVVNFSPTATGTRTTTLNVADSASNSPQQSSLSGTGTTPPAQVTLSPATQGFGSSFVGIAAPTKTFTLSNTGTSTVTGVVVSFVGNNTGDFADTGGTCSTSLGASSSCTIVVTFTPQAAGSRTTKLNVADSDPSSPQQSTLTGTGVAQSVTATPSSLAFGPQTQGTASPSQTITVTNATSSTLTLGSITYTGTNGSDFSTSSTTCTGTLASNATCTIAVVFTPTQTPITNETGTLNLAYTGFTGSPLLVNMTGTSSNNTPPLPPGGLTITSVQ